MARSDFYLSWWDADRCSNRALTPPGYHKEWHNGIRGLPNNNLVGFISAIPLKLGVRDK